ncbi:uroporphyrinogen-III C-methyltransferase [Rhodococcus artemisiae]
MFGLDLTDRHVVVVGSGPEVERRLESLLASGARPLVLCLDPTPALRSMAVCGRIVLEVRTYSPEDLDSAWLAVACTGDPNIDAAVAVDAEQRRVLCSSASARTAGDATTAPRASIDLSRRAHEYESRSRSAMPPGVALVGGGPGDPDLITVRGRRLLESADVVVTDRLAPTSLLTGLPAEVEVVDASKVPRGPHMTQDTINRVLIENARAGKFVVRLKGGDPYVFGRGYEEVKACTAAGVPVTVVPGVTSAIAAPSSASIPVTHRGAVHEFVVASGHLPPGHPDSMTDWHLLAKLRGTLVILMGVENLEAIAQALMSGGRALHTPVAVIQEGTWETQRVARTHLRGVSDLVRKEEIRPPAVVVVGDVAAFTTTERDGIKDLVHGI